MKFCFLGLNIVSRLSFRFISKKKLLKPNMSTTANINRIPVNVNHYQQNAGNISNPNSDQRHFSRDFHHSTSNKYDNQQQKQDYNANDRIYEMKSIYDETDRIKNRMKEFEDRCKRWREDFFTKTSTNNFNDSLFHKTQFEQSTPFNLANTDLNHNQIKTAASISEPKIGAPFTSSMHRSVIEDLKDGSGKTYRIEFDIGDFKQNELLLSTIGRILIIKGDRELKAGSATETKTFNRELTLPDYVDLNKMNAFLVDNIMSTHNESASSFRSSQTQLVSHSNVNNILVVEAPILMEKYSYRRSAFDKSQSPVRISSPIGSSITNMSPIKQNTQQQYSAKVLNSDISPTRSSKTTTTTKTTSESHHHAENQTSTSHQTISKLVQNGSGYDLNMHIGEDDNYNLNANVITSPVKTNRFVSNSQSNLNSNQSLTPELLDGYPIYDNNESCVVYKFDLSGFDQSEIHLTITVDRTLEIKACKEQVDHLGKVYREFKREIALEQEVDASLIKNVLHEGILTLKIPKANRPDGLGSLSNNHNLQTPNGFKEIYNDDGKLAKLNADCRGKLDNRINKIALMFI